LNYRHLSDIRAKYFSSPAFAGALRAGRLWLMVRDAHHPEPVEGVERVFKRRKKAKMAHSIT